MPHPTETVRTDTRPVSEFDFEPVLVLPQPKGILRPDFVWIDCEASSLSTVSYPIEIGWAFDDLSGQSFLIRPEDDWTDWAWEAEQVHGITREELLDTGISAKEAAERLNTALAGRHVFTDTVDMDGTGGTDMMWLRRLYMAAQARVAFRLFHPNIGLGKALNLHSKEAVDAVLPRVAEAEDLAERVYPHTHRAAADSVSMASSFRMSVDDAFLDEVRAYERELGPRARRP